RMVQPASGAVACLSASTKRSAAASRSTQGAGSSMTTRGGNGACTRRRLYDRGEGTPSRFEKVKIGTAIFSTFQPKRPLLSGPMPREKKLSETLSRVEKGGAEKYHRKNAETGKLFARERIARLIDPGTFVEDAALANNLESDLPA